MSVYKSAPWTTNHLTGGFSHEQKKTISLAVALPALIGAVLYAAGLIAQLIGNYNAWQVAGGLPGDRTSPLLPSMSFTDCVRSVFSPPYGIYGIFICAALIIVLVVFLMKLGHGNKGEYDRDRNFIYSKKGTYGTSGFMTDDEMKTVLNTVTDIRKHNGTILGKLGKQILCMPEGTMLNSNIAVYGASGSKKTRAFCLNMILQCAARGESLIITDPKSELYEKTSEYLRSMGYTVKVFNLVSPENSDSWNCLAEIDGQELMAQLFCDVVIKNTGSERGDHFWDSAELNLLKALVLYVADGSSQMENNIGQAYQLLTTKNETELNALFHLLSPSHPAKAPYSIFKQASESVRGGIIIGLGSRLQVFQNEMIRRMTSNDEIDLVLPGKQKCAYYCITSDQDSTFDFLSSLFISFLFIKLVRYADAEFEDRKLPVPVHVLGEELNNVGVIPDLSRKISVIRSRNISMSCIFQNLAGLQNRYPNNQWQEILGNCDVQLFLGCTDELTAKFISGRTGIASVEVSSEAKTLNSWRISNYTHEFRTSSGVGKRNVLTMDEVLRLPLDKELIIIRGHKALQADKYDYSSHPEAEKLTACKASEYFPRRLPAFNASPPVTPEKPEKPVKPAKSNAPAKTARTEKSEKSVKSPQKSTGPVTTTDKNSIVF